ncbi:uncharacterized protein I303_100865 [Kwoniella dejecticola CBS 10117]|uniref:Uncharacterized protein n=1 Tax=Kwoniella dejecticola CBS 10117 TaxID=1296121 RepID=A0A1A6AG85_9TREE|nr:uncharacterized protein I303_00868 [Kwoniella dejecticola CBS 10117]OBR89046.1 hypothetical protein I303_00868 [Kwoniella dejecticola CBS 10117]
MSGLDKGAKEQMRTLPIFEGLFGKQTNTLLRPFSRFSISSLFGSSSPSAAIPPNSLIEPLLAQASSLQPNAVPLTHELIKNLEGLKEFATRFKDFVISQEVAQSETQVQEGIHKLCQAYLAGIYLISSCLWAIDPSTDFVQSKEQTDFKAALPQCILGFFIVYSLDLDPPDNGLDKHLLGSIFTPTATQYNYLSPLLAHPPRLIADLQSQPTRPIAHSKLKPPMHSPVVASFPESTIEHETSYIVSLLNVYLEGIQNIQSLAGPIMAKNKMMREEDARRPRRIEMEVQIMRCDLLLSMTTKQIDEVKRRAMNKVQEEDAEDEIEEDEGNRDAFETRQTNAGVSVLEDSDEVDIKPRLSGESDLPFDEFLLSAQSASKYGKNRHDDSGIKWEDQAEKSLVQCLESAKQLLDKGRGEVLSSQVEALDWLGQSGVISSEDEKRSTRTSRSPTHVDDPDEASTSDDESEDSFSSETESEPEETEELLHPCPLRTIFRLQDRYEEQRLAVWLHLPSAKRGKMGWFMRGEDGRVGAIWDAFGLAALMQFDSETLLRYGLGADKLDKWVELAAVKNAKKIKRRGKKNV